MSIFLIPLNDANLPANNFMTENLANEIYKSEIFQKNKSIIETHPLFIAFSKLPLKKQKETFEGFMSHELSEKLDEELSMSYSFKSNKKELSLSKKKYDKKYINRKQKIKSLRNSRFSVKTPSLYLRGGSSFGTVLATIIIIIFILYNIFPNLFDSMLKRQSLCNISSNNQNANNSPTLINEEDISNLQKKIQEINNISTDKNSVRLVFFVLTESDNYFLKIAPSDYINKKEEAYIFNIQNLKYNYVGEYVYECLIYEEMNKPTGVIYNGRDINSYVSELVDWNIKKIKTDTNKFLVNLDDEEINLNTVPTTYNGKNNKLCKNIFNNIWDYCPGNNFSYSLIKHYPGFTTFKDYIKDRSFDCLIEIFKNTCSLLRLFYREKGFCHWDLHGENLLVNGLTGEVKLFDFDFSVVYNSKSVTYKGYIDFVVDPRINIKPVFGHLYDYYRFIYQNIIFYPHLNKALARNFGKTEITTTEDINEIIYYFTTGDLNILEASPEHYSDSELKKYEEIALTITDPESYFVNLITTLYFFNEVI